MGNIIRIGIVGAPHSGKTTLVNHLKDYLSDDYIVFIAEDVSDRLFRLGLNPLYNISEVDFQIECLKAYGDLYKDVDSYIKKYTKGIDKDIIVIYDTVPAESQCYLNSSEDLHKWIEQSTKEKFSEYKMDLVFVADLLPGEYSYGSSVRRYLDIEEVLAIADRIDYVFQSCIKLSNDLILEERASIIVDELNKYLGLNSSEEE